MINKEQQPLSIKILIPAKGIRMVLHLFPIQVLRVKMRKRKRLKNKQEFQQKGS